MTQGVFAAIRTAHAWAGAVLSLLLAVLGFSGALLVFKDDYVRAVLPEARAVIAPAPARLAAIAESAERTFGADAVRSIRFARGNFGLSFVRLHSGENAYLNGKGEVVAIWTESGRFEEWIFDLHHHLLAGTTGEVVAGIAGLCAVILALTGLIALWPARRALGRRLWPASLERTDILAAHRNLGLVAAAPLLLFTLTGAAMVFKAETLTILSVFDRAAASKQPNDLAEIGRRASEDIDWEAALSAAQLRFPDAAIRVVVWPRENRPAASVRLRQPGEWHPNGRANIEIDPVTSGILATADSRTLPRGERIFNSFYPLHSAHLGTGLIARIYDFLAASVGAALGFLGLFGVYAFLKMRRPPLRLSRFKMR